MKKPKPSLVLLRLALVLSVVIAFIIGWTVLRQEPTEDADQARDSRPSVKQAESPDPAPENPGIRSKRPEDATRATASRKPGADLLPPSQVAGRVFPKVDLDALAISLPEEKFAAYERMRAEFPNVDWTETDPTYRAFMDKRLQLPLNLNDEQRETHAAWLGEAAPVRQELVRLRAEAQGLIPTGQEGDRGYYVDGFRNGVPQYMYAENSNAAISTGVSFVRGNPGLDPFLGDTINGSEAYMTVSDVGEVLEHPEFQLPNSGGSRILYKQLGGMGQDHSTHVAGTMGAWGYDPALQGMAPRGWLRTLLQLDATHISTWGMATPGQQTGVTNPRTGTPQLKSVVGNASLGTTEFTIRYTDYSRNYDIALRDYPYHIFFAAAGNSGPLFTSLTGEFKTAKNTVVIGNANDVARDSQGAFLGGGVIYSTSSRGPTYDGRIKPDFVGNGFNLTSPVSATATGVKTGTSMASPNVAGSVALLMDYVRQRLPQQQYLRHPTYKALLMSTTDDLGNPGPDYTYGWGLVNVHAAAKIIRQHAESTAKRLIIEDSLSPSQTWTETYVTDGSKPISVSIAWLDPDGVADTDGDRSPRLVNDLDVRLIGPGGTVYSPYVMPFTTGTGGTGGTAAFDISLYDVSAVTGDNITDPLEQVRIATPVTGTYVVQVTHKGTLKDNQAQQFSVAVSGLRKEADVYDLSITPNSLSLQAASGLTASSPLTLTNTGSLPVIWSMETDSYQVTTSAQAGGPAYVWNDISANGTQITGLTDDNNLGPFPIGFSMPFYGKNFTEFRVCSNGWLSFTSTSINFITTSSASNLPSTTRPENLIAPLLRDLDPIKGGTVHYQQVDSDTFVVQFTNVPMHNYPANLCTFQVVMKRDGTIFLYYQKADYPTVGLVGMQNEAMNDGITLAYNKAFLSPNLAVRLQPTWFAPTPSSGTLPVGSSATVTVTANAAGLFSQNYAANLIVKSNDTETPVQTVPVNFTVGASPPSITTWPTATSLVYGQALSASTLSGGSASVAGSFAFSAPATVPSAGTQSEPVTFTPTDTATYSPVSGSVSVDVAKATPVVTAWPTASSIASGQALSASTLSGGTASVAGSFTFNSPTTVLNPGTQSVAVTFTPAVTANYQTVAGTVQVQVLGGTSVTVTAWPTASAIVYGQALSASTLTGGTASVAGSFSFNSPNTLLNAGTQSVAVTFTPTDAATYNSAQGSVSVVVAKATPLITASPTASAIVYGQALSASTLSGGTASVAGIFAFSAPTTVLDAGTQSVSVTFTPTDTANYNPAQVNASVVVAKASSVITASPTASAIVYGQALSVSNLTGGTASVAGTFAFSAPTTVLNAGTHSVEVTFAPTDTANYNPVSGSVSIVVAKATPVITAWPTASAINYNQYLSASTLSSGSASVAGAFAFSDAALQFTGHDAFTFRVSDGTLVSEPATVSLTVGAPAAMAAALTPNAAAPASAIRGDGYTVVTFAESGTWTVPNGVNAVEVLVVGGGGAGGGQSSGGGAGGMLYVPSYTVSPGGSISVTVGSGGVAGAFAGYDYRPGTSGSPSKFGDGSATLIAYGGGFGGSYSTGGTQGGSSINNGTIVVSGQPGGGGVSGNYAGGGGAGAPGGNMNNSKGGLGLQNAITGTASYYAGGGAANPAGLPQLGGGGGGVGYTPSDASDLNGTNGLGGGGGGGHGGTNPGTGYGGGHGGSGIVIVAYMVNNLAPTANAQSVTVEPGSPKAITLTGSDPDSDPLTYEILTQPTYGTLSGTAPDVTYTPPALPAAGAHSVAVTFTPTDTANYQIVTSTVSVSVNSAITTYAQWATQYPGHDLSNASADNDGDGLNNFHEYAFGLNPTSGNSNNPIVTPLDKANHSFSYTRRANSSLTYTVCISTDLNSWQDLLPTQVTENVSVNAETQVETVGVTIPFTSLPDTNNLFLRVKAQ